MSASYTMVMQVGVENIKIQGIMNLMLNIIQWCLNVHEQNIYMGIWIRPKCKSVNGVQSPMRIQLAVEIDDKSDIKGLYK